MTDSIHVVCPQCNAANRLSPARLTDRPNCGKCHQPLFSGHPADLNDAEFSRQIERSDVPVLVDFWAPWCGPCRAMAPAYEQAAKTLEPHVRVIKVNTEQAQATAARFGIRSIPTLMIFKRGHEVARKAGAMSTADIVRWTQSQTTV